MLSSLKAWKEIIGLYGAKDRKNEIREYYRALSVNALRREGLFDFLRTPQTIQDIMDHFGYTDKEFLLKYLTAYTEDKILEKENGTYRTNGLVAEFPVNPPDYIGPGILQITTDAASAIPNRLKGIYTTFSDEMNTFNWDDSLQMEMYAKIRQAAFKYTDALKRRGTFIDVGCGNGIGTASIWAEYYKKGVFNSGPPVKIYGLEFDPNLKQIAEDEFVYAAARILDVDRKVIEDLEEHHPVFVQGTAEELPFENEFFDMVYTSQVIHWCDAEKATKEMMRVLKPDGLFFGTEAFSPFMDTYVELYILLNEGAYGSIKKEDFFQWATDAGAISAKSATPAGVFRIVKS